MRAIWFPRRAATAAMQTTVRWGVLLAVLGAMLAWLGSAGAGTAQKAVSFGSIQGTPITGAKGVQESTASIMARQVISPPIFRGVLPWRTNEAREALLSSEASSPAATPTTVRAPKAPQTLGTQFTGATGPTETGTFPPDTMGTVGPTQFFVFLNGRLRTFNKTTGTADGVINADPNVFFSSVMTPVGGSVVRNFTSDPRVRYDRLSGRWILTIVDVPCANAGCTTTNNNRALIAVSDAASNGVISGATVWTFYFFQGSGGNFLDYDTLGVDNLALYMGGNMFTNAAAFVGTDGYVVRKSSVLSGGPIVVTTFTNLAAGGGAGPFAPQGVDNYDPSSTEGYFIGVDNATFSKLMFRRVSDPGGTPTISANISLAVATTSFPRTVTHLGNTGGPNGNLAARDDRLFAAHIRGGKLWTAHNLAVTAAGGASGSDAQRRDGVRWYELNGIRSTDNGGVPIVVQSGTIFDTAATVAAARQYWIPSVMVSGQGHAALGYSTAGAPFRIDAATSGRLVGDALGTTQAVSIYTSSSTAYNPPSDPGGSFGRRWGDYSYTSLDPLDDMTMWTIQEFCDGTNTYGVRAVKLIAPEPATPASASPPSAAVGLSSVNVTITGTQVAGSGFYDPGPNLGGGAVNFNHIAGSMSGGVTVNSATYNGATSVTLNVSTVGATPGTHDVTITDPDGQSKTGMAIFTTTGTTAVKLAAISAVRTRAGVSIRWRTASETNLVGFNVYRGELRLSRRLVLARGSTGGHAYSWRDRAPATVRRTYRIQAVLVNGSRVWLGAVRS
jgi:hypothetical protein